MNPKRMTRARLEEIKCDLNIRGGFLSDIDIIDLLANAEATVDEPKPEPKPADNPAVRDWLAGIGNFTWEAVSKELRALLAEHDGRKG